MFKDNHYGATKVARLTGTNVFQEHYSFWYNFVVRYNFGKTPSTVITLIQEPTGLREARRDMKLTNSIRITKQPLYLFFLLQERDSRWSDTLRLPFRLQSPLNEK